MNIFTAKWPFYISGALLAILVALSMYLFNDYIGLSDAMIAVSDYCDKAVMDQNLAQPLPEMDWQFGMLFGIFFGALCASLMSNNFKFELLTDSDGSFTVKTVKTVFGGIAGGFLIMLGIQLSGDTILGHWAGAFQCSSGAWVFLIGMVLTGCTLAILLERRGGGSAKGASAPKKK